MIVVKELLRRRTPLLAGFKPEIDAALRDFTNREKTATRSVEQEEYGFAVDYLNNILRKVEKGLKSLNRKEDEELWGISLYSYENVSVDVLDKISRRQDMTRIDYGVKLASDRLLRIFGIPGQIIEGRLDRKVVEQMGKVAGLYKKTQIEPKVFADMWTIFVQNPNVFVEFYYRRTEDYPFQCNLMFDLAKPAI